MSDIKLGTSGWRATIADNFTAANVQKLSQALSNHVTAHTEYGFSGSQYRRYCKERKFTPKKPLVIVGYDTRFMSEYFARVAADTLSVNSISVLFASRPVPVPVVAWSVLENGAVGGITVTASEGISSLNGIKWTPYWGGPATPEVANDIESRLSGPGSGISKMGLREFGVLSPAVETAEIADGYFEQLSSIVDVNTIRKAGLKVAVDSLYGSISGYLRPFLDKIGVTTYGLHEERDVLFGGHAPYTGPESLASLSSFVAKNKLSLGIACDCDGDRFGIVDSDGTWISPNDMLPLILDHLAKNKGMRGKVCRNVVTSHFLDAVAKNHGFAVRETPVGFKFIGELMRTGQYLLGGEESGGATILGHVPEKDGMLVCLLALEMLAYERKPLKKIREEMRKRYGGFLSIKKSLSVENIKMADVTERLTVKPPLELAGCSVWRIDQTDGFKFVLRDGSWLGLRPSGTEPIVRIYAEAATTARLNSLVAEADKIIKGEFK